MAPEEIRAVGFCYFGFCCQIWARAAMIRNVSMVICLEGAVVIGAIPVRCDKTERPGR